MPAQQRTYYQVLGISPKADLSEIKAAYRKAARTSHPDYGGDSEQFRLVTEAYQVLSVTQTRAKYDASFGTFRPQGSTVQAPRPHTGSDTSAGPARRTSTQRAGGLPIFVPAFSATVPPILPLDVASAQNHGEPRKRGIFSAGARLERERRTADLLSNGILKRYPAARLFNTVASPTSKVPLEHVLLMGYRIAIVSSIQVPEGAYRWNGISLRHGAQSIAPPQTLAAARALGELFHNCTVTAWTIVLGPAGARSEPALDYAPRAAPGGDGYNVIAARNVYRELGSFLASGAQPDVVDLDVVSRLLGALE